MLVYGKIPSVFSSAPEEGAQRSRGRVGKTWISDYCLYSYSNLKKKYWSIPLCYVSRELCT